MSKTIEEDIFGCKGKSNHNKAKGNANERECAKALKAWTGYNFVRSPQSGGLRWRNSANVSADLICDEVGVDFIYSVETKHLKDLTKADILRIWRQVSSDALRSVKIPLALLRTNGMKKHEYYFVLQSDKGGSMLHALGIAPIATAHGKEYSLHIFMLSTVSASIKFSVFDKLMRKRYHSSSLLKNNL